MSLTGYLLVSPYADSFKWQWDDRAEELCFVEDADGFDRMDDWELQEWEAAMAEKGQGPKSPPSDQ